MLLRLVVIGLLFTLTCPSSDAGSTKTARDKYELLGPVRMVTTKSSTFSEIENYDRAGNLIASVIYFEYNKTSTRHVFTYNQKGGLQEEAAYDGEGTLKYRKLFAYGYDSDGRETAVVAASQDGAFNHAEFSIYDDRGNLSESVAYSGSGIYRNVFDVQGQIVYSAWFNDGQLFSERKWSYDNNGQLKELISYSPGGTVTGKSIKEYDDSGKLIRETFEKYYQGTASKFVTLYEFDDAGNWIKELMRKESGVASDPSAAPYSVVRERVIVYYENR